ncbi:hypothetical protein UFOVP111_138 [uncultured Caudovirales phage]|uniref:Uncharacterized protein n=1 Tax=uncultured Caudovirales phage TaxID=2100421 RepID=A0A6J5L8F8_9CAUD|nr:hypothetical protein UFOVP111_138 [uncultured Caudovirales phage]
MTPKEYRENLDRELGLGLITLEAYLQETAALRLAEAVIKD